jgi:hypothetical protein
LLALGEHAAAKLCAELSDRDITNLAIGFADLGRLDAEEVEKLIEEFPVFGRLTRRAPPPCQQSANSCSPKSSSSPASAPTARRCR